MNEAEKKVCWCEWSMTMTYPLAHVSERAEWLQTVNMVPAALLGEFSLSCASSVNILKSRPERAWHLCEYSDPINMWLRLIHKKYSKETSKAKKNIKLSRKLPSGWRFWTDHWFTFRFSRQWQGEQVTG